jgi:hypothetical protein
MSQLHELGGDVPPPAGQEARLVARLRAEGLLRPPAPAPRVAAAVALFAAGLLAGWWVARPRAAAAEPGPRYVLLLESAADMPGDEGARVQAVIAWARQQRAAGVKLAGEKLADGGEVVSAAGVAPAPAALGGYFVVQAPDDAAARRIAASHPLLGWGGRVVVRRIEELPPRR